MPIAHRPQSGETATSFTLSYIPLLPGELHTRTNSLDNETQYKDMLIAECAKDELVYYQKRPRTPDDSNLIAFCIRQERKHDEIIRDFHFASIGGAGADKIHDKTLFEQPMMFKSIKELLQYRGYKFAGYFLAPKNVDAKMPEALQCRIIRPKGREELALAQPRFIPESGNFSPREIVFPRGGGPGRYINSSTGKTYLCPRPSFLNEIGSARDEFEGNILARLALDP